MVRLDKIHRDIEVMIMMTDDDEDLLLMAPLFLTSAKNILIALMGDKKAKLVLTQFVDEIKIEE